MASAQHTALLSLAGQAAYDGGKVCFAEGQVKRLITRGERTSATVVGSASYRVELRETARGYDGNCTCPASEGFDFCEHCVAVALALEARQDKLRDASAAGPGERIRLFLDGLPRDTLAHLLLQAAAHDPDLEQRLALQADAASGALDLRRLKQMVTAALPLKHIMERRKAAAYFARAEAAIANLQAIADHLAPAEVLATATHAIRRLGKVLERVDDSDGHRWPLQERLRTLHATALAEVDWPPAKVAGHLLDLVLADDTDTLNDAVALHRDALGDAGRTALYSDIRKRLEALPELEFGASFDAKYPFLRLSALLRDKLEADGDIAGQIELARRTCTSARDCQKIAQLYLALPDLEQALVWLDRADGAPGHRQVDYATRVAVHRARGEWSAATSAQRQLFQAQPTRLAYDTLMDLAELAEQRAEAESAARRFLRTRIQAGTRDRSVCADTLASILRDEGKSGAAYELVLSAVDDEQSLLGWAAWCADELDATRGLTLGGRAVDLCAARGPGIGYRQALAALERLRPVAERAGEMAFAKFVRQTRIRHKARRPFVAMLDKAVAEF